MNKNQLAPKLKEAYQPILEIVSSIDETTFKHAPHPERWTASQHLQHLILSTQMFNQGLRMPKGVLKERFGTRDREERNYEETKEKYKLKLSEGGVATSRYIPKSLNFGEKERMASDLQKELKNLLAALEKWTEIELSEYVLPHPLLGKLTIRELFGFTIFHTEHHTHILKEEYLK